MLMDSTVNSEKLYELMKKSGISIKEAIMMLQNVKGSSEKISVYEILETLKPLDI